MGLHDESTGAAMMEQDKTREQLITENEELRRRVADIDEQKRTQAALQESEERFRKVFEEGPIGIVLVNTDGRIQHANQHFCEMLGYSENEIIALGLAGISHPGDWERDYPLVSRLWRGEVPYCHLEKRYLRKDGQPVWCQLTVSLMHDDAGRPINNIGMIEEITERKRAKEALQKAHDELEQRVKERTAELTKANEELVLFHKFAEASGQGFGMGDLDARIAYVNPALCRLFGEHKPEDLIGKSFLAYYPEEWRQRRKEEMIPTLERAGHWAGEQAVLSRQGQLIPTLHDDFQLRDEEGNPIRRCVVVADITERKRAEEALRESRNKLQAIYDGMADGLLIGDCATGRLWRTNPAMCGMLGCTEDELLSMSVKDIHPAEVVPAVLQMFGTQREGERTIAESRPMLRKDGTVFYADISNVRISYQGRPCVIGIFRDMSERRQAQEALQQAHDELRAIYDGMGDGLLVADIETREFVQTNASMCRMLGYSERELLSMSVKDIHPKSDLPFVLEQFQALAEGTILVSEEIPVLRKDGNVFYAVVTTSRVSHGNRRCVVGFFRDVTDRRHAEELLRESEAKYRHLVETTDTGYLILDEEGRVVDANAEYVRLTGHQNLGEIMGRRVEQWTASHDAERNAQEVRECLKRGAVRQLEIDYLGPDGKITPIEINASVIGTKQGRRIISLCRDITERKRAEEALQRQHQTLKHLLHSSDHERQLIAYEIHDGLAQELAGALMQFQAYDHLKDTQPKQAANAYAAGLTMLQQGHFEARRLIAGVRPPILDESGIVEAIAHLVHEQGRYPAQKIDFHSRVGFDRLDPTLENAIYRIAQEGLANACKHSKSEKIRVSLLQRGDRVRIEIRDWGTGFDAKAVPKRRFGLEGIRQRARLLGGKCGIRSTAGKGARITVELPVVPRDEEA
jgi:PAS domain S-box-containing protein